MCAMGILAWLTYILMSVEIQDLFGNWMSLMISTVLDVELQLPAEQSLTFADCIMVKARKGQYGVVGNNTTIVRSSRVSNRNTFRGAVELGMSTTELLSSTTELVSSTTELVSSIRWCDL